MSHMCQAKADENQELVSAIWGLSGDIHIMLTQHATDLEIHQEDFLQQWEEDREIWESARLELGSAGEEDFLCLVYVQTAGLGMVIGVWCMYKQQD